MKQGIYTIRANEAIAPSVYRMILSGDTSPVSAPGQFVNLKIEGLYLRRPLSICDWDEETMTLIYKTVGQGTEALAAMRPGQSLDLLAGLGNGFDTAVSCERPLLIGGGVGVPPLYGLCRRLIEQGKAPRVILGFNTAREVFYEKAFAALGAAVTVTTADGSLGVKGFVTAAMDEAPYDYFYACGPLPMFKAIDAVARTSGQMSFEERMGCGFGACMGCSCKTKNGPKRICTEGPVLVREEVQW